MRRKVTRALGVAAFLPVLLAACGTSLASAEAGGWGTAIQVPGTAALNTGGGAGITSVSCASPGNCSAVGTYATTGHYHVEAFVVSQVRGTWHKAAEIPGLASLNRDRYASVGSVSCASPGNCAAGGSYKDGARHLQAFVVDQVHGRWRQAVRVRGTAALNALGAGVSSVSCATAGNCSAGGSYLRRFRYGQAFVVSEVNGTWGTAIEVPGIAALNTNGTAGINSVSCASPGNCSAGGTYRDSSGDTRAFVVSQVHGVWGTAILVPGTAALGASGGAGVSAVSCASPGDCAVAGYYYDSQGFEYPFVENQVNGVWGTARKVQGMAAFRQRGAGQFYTVSCGSPGNCAAGGSEGVNNGYDVGGGGQPFVVTETGGTWGKAELVPGITALNTGADGAVTSVSCPSAGNCGAAGYYGVGKPDQKIYDLEVFVVSEVHGAWSRAAQIPGTRELNKRHWAGVGAVSCAAAGRCSAGGSYADGSGRGQAFAVSEGGPALRS